MNDRNGNEVRYPRVDLMQCPRCSDAALETTDVSEALRRCARCGGIWVEPHASPAIDDLRDDAWAGGGDFAGAIRALLDRNAELTAIMDNLPVEVALKDLEGRYVYVNRYTERLYSRSNEVVRGKYPHELFSQSVAEDIRTHDHEVLASGQSRSVEIVDEAGRTFLATTFPARDSTGRVVGLAGIGLEITKRVEAENEVAKLNVELEARVERRTRQLRDAQNELLTKERLATLGRLTATVSHELRNPLGAMRTSLFVIQKRLTQKDERLTRALDRVERDIGRCDRIIDELLDYARAGTAIKKKVSIDLWLSALLDEQDSVHDVELRVDLGTAGELVSIDGDRLHRALVNVLDNACQSMADDDRDASKPSVLKVSTRVTNGRVEIEVADTGVGISPEVLPRVFEPLFSTKGFGTGLGLAAVKDILESHDGGVEIQSVLDEGTQLTLWLPRD